nr:DNA gyrase subunit A [Clostridia bacterium]
MKNNKNRRDEEVSLEFENQKIVDIPMGKEVKKSFIDYAMSVIMSRALPDARDGLKPVHRRILYAMYEDHLTYDKPFHKSAATVGNVLGRYHPHGDAAVYDSMVRLAQNFSLRYPLIEGHGNFGNIDGDQAAAYRYTEARMARLADEMMRDIKKETVDFGPNFDSKLKEPLVLPSRFPNLLVNGSVGIAVGMATNIPPHNLGEVIDGIGLMLDDPDVSPARLMEVIKGPDFPTGAIIMGNMGIAQAYATGKGHITVRARAEVEEAKHRIIITEIPYAVNKAALVEAMADCVKDKRIEGVTALRDESGRDGMRIVVEFRHDANGQLILNQFYKYTQLQDTFAVNMLALVDNIPKILTLRDALSLYIKHQEEVIIRRTRFDLADASREAHLNEGFKFAIDNIDRVIEVIRSSGSMQEAKENLMSTFTADNVENFLTAAGAVHTSGITGLTEAQAQAIVDMPLGRLAGMERAKIEERLHALYERIKELEQIIADETLVKGIIRDELAEIRRRFADERRTEIVADEDEIIPEDLIERHKCVVTLTHTGYIKRLPADTYSAQRRGGKGVIGMATKDEDAVEKVIASHSHSDLLMFTNLGRVHTIRCYRIPEASRTARGSHTVNLLELGDGEKVTAMIPVAKYDADMCLTLVTKLGEVRRTSLSEFENQRKGGKIAFNLEDGDELLFAR